MKYSIVWCFRAKSCAKNERRGFPGGSVVKRHLPVKETWVWYLIWEDPTCRGIYWACVLDRDMFQWCLCPWCSAAWVQFCPRNTDSYYASFFSSLSNVSLILNSVNCLKPFYAKLVQACLLINEKMIKFFFLGEWCWKQFRCNDCCHLMSIYAHFSPTFFFKLEFVL